MKDMFLWFVGRRIHKLDKQVKLQNSLIDFYKERIEAENIIINSCEEKMKESVSLILKLGKNIALLKKVKKEV